MSPCSDGQPPDGGWSNIPGSDCDDENNNIAGGVIGDNLESSSGCDGIDNNCNGLIDEYFTTDNDGDYYTICDGDCNDQNPLEFPGQTWYPDCDGDGVFGPSEVIACSLNEANAMSPCGDGLPPDGGWSNSLGDYIDCDDDDPNVYPGLDWYPDCDGDGYFSDVALTACSLDEVNAMSPCGDGLPPDGGWSNSPGDDADCDDEDPNQFPGQTWYPDCDGDGYFSPVGIIACSQAEAENYSPCNSYGWSFSGGSDCNDQEETVYPGAPEIPCDGYDNDCSGDGDAMQDFDGDGLFCADDPCPYDADNDIDSDGICGDVDNCPDTYNPVQSDLDNDGIGDLCDTDFITPEKVVVGTDTTSSMLQVKGGSLFIDSQTGSLILRSPNGNCYIILVDDGGTLLTVRVDCPGE
jgi:hypothetical protein